MCLFFLPTLFQVIYILLVELLPRSLDFEESEQAIF
ncbi:hypothetical protein VDIAB_80001 [Vibrio diabolicus]|nr:hypothetical protein VDIAB_80001 [Vibrio diabolicus]